MFILVGSQPNNVHKVSLSSCTSLRDLFTYLHLQWSACSMSNVICIFRSASYMDPISREILLQCIKYTKYAFPEYFYLLVRLPIKSLCLLKSAWTLHLTTLYLAAIYLVCWEYILNNDNEVLFIPFRCWTLGVEQGRQQWHWLRAGWATWASLPRWILFQMSSLHLDTVLQTKIFMSKDETPGFAWCH